MVHSVTLTFVSWLTQSCNRMLWRQTRITSYNNQTRLFDHLASQPFCELRMQDNGYRTGSTTIFWLISNVCDVDASCGWHDVYRMFARDVSEAVSSSIVKQTNLKLWGLLCWAHRIGSRAEFGSVARTLQSRFNNVCFHMFGLLPKRCEIWTKSKTIKNSSMSPQTSGLRLELPQIIFSVLTSNSLLAVSLCYNVWVTLRQRQILT
jgi:hypothetical protein